MENRVALVTGGMGGIGTAICHALANKGVKVAAAYHRNTDAAKTWQTQQKEAGFDIVICYADIGDFSQCEKLVKEVQEQLGPIDILVNNAGITNDAQLKNMTPEQWQSVMHTNLDSIFNVTRQVVNQMIERNYGRIINISSINGHKGQFGQTNYSAAKSGMYGFTKALAQEVARKGVTVNTISPGYIATEMVMAVPEKIREQIIAQIPLNRLGKPEEIARVVAFLAEEESAFITGADFAINGGQYMY